ncbi:MAG TPA: hypothetical protein PLU39_11770 [Armatimonadota bacterium]|jgi:hypothetical protein|nr:hypothetical protein [Armatimonadota bacterium]HOJ20355.1 hypothetical protein [Armatimonadota bacterium]HOM80751.1 hypothetical protein [Armatimonadota bacterium]HPO73899.1 hypothetical protein [Armatimonadota bacterium]HPT98535.1 hypothetical protein [Armatimonadota bacterium]
MMPIIPLPDAVPVPAPIWLVHFLLLLTFTLHLVPMSFTLGGGILAAVAAFRGRRDENQRRLSEVIARALPSVTAFTITTGVAPLLFVQVVYGQLFYTSSVLMAWLWMGVIPLLIAGYYGYYACALAPRALGKHQPWVATASAVAAAAIGFLWVMNVLLMLSPEKWSGIYAQSAAGLYVNVTDPVVWPRFAHMLVGALAVTGVWIAVLSRAQAPVAPEFATWMRRQGIGLFTGATAVNLAVGTWFLFSLPKPALDLFSGGMTPSLLLLGLGILLGVAAIGLLRVHLWLGTAAIAVALACMAILRHQVRLSYVAPYFNPETLAVQPQWGVFAIFAVALVVALGIVGWMTVTYLKAGRKKEAGSAREASTTAS